MTCASLKPGMPADTTVKFSGLGSVSTLVTPTSGSSIIEPQEIQIVVFGDGCLAEGFRQEDFDMHDIMEVAFLYIIPSAHSHADNKNGRTWNHDSICLSM